MYSFRNHNNFDYSNTNISNQNEVPNVTLSEGDSWIYSADQFPSNQISSNVPCYVAGPYINDGSSIIPTPEYSPSYNDQLCMLSSNVAQFTPISPVEDSTSLDALGCYNDTPLLTNNHYQYSSYNSEPMLKIDGRGAKTYHNNNNMAKKHRAQISLVSTSAGNFKAVVKRKRKRTVFTTEQVAALEEIFTRKPYINREDRQILVHTLQINDKAIKIWFQNRRLKGKKVHDEEPDERLTEDRITSDISRLDYLQSQIAQKTDANGYVTLDERVMGDLADMIDNFLTDDSGLSMPCEETSNIESSPIYEPISPASDCGESHEDAPTWKPAEPNDSLQRLFDIQSMLTL